MTLAASRNAGCPKNELFPDFNDAVLGAGDNVPVAGLAQGQARYPVKMA